MRQIVIVFNIAARANRWQREFLASCQGASLTTPEPKWNFGFNGAKLARARKELDEFKKRKKGKRNGKPANRH